MPHNCAKPGSIAIKGEWSWLDFEETPIELAKGSLLFRQGDPIERLYYLARGRIKLIRHTQEGDQVVLHIGTAGELIAEASLFAQHYHCTALIDQAACIYQLRRESALQWILANPENSQTVLELFSRQIRDLRGLIEIRNIRSARTRILAYLEGVATTDGKVLLSTSLRDIAYKLGLAHETLYRELRALEESGLIDRSERGIIKIKTD